MLSASMESEQVIVVTVWAGEGVEVSPRCAFPFREG